MPDLETLLNPDNLAYWEGLPDDAFNKFLENYRKLQTNGQEMAAELLAASPGGEAAD